ncbi:alpha/beta hydrolase [Alloscardovia criceti]|uniref:alpha/beta hydrolase n=1 Tax=Alloscardovia criceti TaxID=356828 RepID=UPI00039C4C10|nr:alpha/beta hydrolase-fold protein [Alloscardovia criceti]
MYNWFLNVHIDHGWVIWSVIVLVFVLCVLLLPIFVPASAYRKAQTVSAGDESVDAAHNAAHHHRGHRAQHEARKTSLFSQHKWYMTLLIQMLSALAGLILGWVTVWLLSDVFLVFGVGLGRKVFIRVAFGCAVAGYAIASLVLYRSWRRIIAICLIPAAILFSASQVNAAYGQYPTIRDLLGKSLYPETDAFPQATTTVSDYLKLAQSGRISVPEHGEIHSVRIPATESGFHARLAVVYVPPAALTTQVPALPVIFIMSGQPGYTSTFFTAGQLGAIADAYAAKHNGLAPVIISPDQLGNQFHNTMCANTIPFGNTETYLMKDVVGWMEKNLPITTDHTHWAIGGFSQGGTCSVELGPKYPELFNYVIDISGEKQPNAGSESTMINTYYGGDKSAYEAHIPENIFNAHPNSHQTILFGSGQLDTVGQADVVYVSQFARKSGWKVKSALSAGSAHDWTTVQNVMRYAVADFSNHAGLGAEVKVTDFPSLSLIPGLTLSDGGTSATSLSVTGTSSTSTSGAGKASTVSVFNVANASESISRKSTPARARHR